jgi:hypothetical protein
MDQLDREISRARSGPPEAYAEVLERAVAACQGDAQAAKYLDVLELHSELAETYDRLGRVGDALRHADVLVEHGYACRPDPRRTGDPERLLGQLRDLRAASLAALGRDQDDLQTAAPVTPSAPTGSTVRLVEQARQMGSERWEPTGLMPLSVGWLPADEYPDWPTHWPDLADSDLVQEEHGGSVPHAVYCRRMERRLRELRDTGAARLSIAPLRAAELDQWVADHEPYEDDPAQLRAQYAADLGRNPSRTIPWPPGRNEPCWCGSGRKYKKCCGAPSWEEPR